MEFILSRSHRKHPFFSWTCADSDACAKRFCNRKFRRKTKELLRIDPIVGQDLAPRKPTEVMDSYDFPKDGKRFYIRGKFLDDSYFDKLLRK